MSPVELERFLHLWSLPAQANATLINLSENHTFLIEGAIGEKWILRVHRAGYNSKAEIESELHWMAALREQAHVHTPRSISGANGQQVQVLKSAQHTRFAVLFAFETGREPQPTDDLLNAFEQLGTLAARCHSHAESFRIPNDFRRMRWTNETILPPTAHWGDWRVAPNVTQEVRNVLAPACTRLENDLAEYGLGASGFGLIHADMRLANLLVDDGQVKLIDFDDCGFGWFGYDFAAAISFMETSSRIPKLLAAWLKGYRIHRQFSDQDEKAIQSMIMLRRMALLAWVGSHGETDLAQSLAPNFAKETAMLAKRYSASGSVFAL